MPPSKTSAAKTTAKKTRKAAASATVPSPRTTPTSVPGPTAPMADGRPPEELVNSIGSGHGFRHDHRPARGHGAEQRGLAYVPVSKLYEGRFGRMFRLPPFVPSPERIKDIADGMVDAPAPQDPLTDNPDIPAGYTYLGQFIDHDITFDPVSSLTRQNDPDALTDLRSPAFDLDNVYGRGPADDPYMYDRDRSGYLLIGNHDNEDDLPRNPQKTAIIGDPRNDENILVGQLQLTMLKFHNAVMDQVVADPRLQRGSETVFEAAQRIVRWHYQWVVVHDFLRRTVGRQMLDSVLEESTGRPVLRLEHFVPRSGRAYMPVEFSVAAYRFGHSQVRADYRLNTLVRDVPIFLPEMTDANRLQHLGGFRELPPRWTIEWARFFEVDGAGKDALQHTRPIDTRISPPLTKLPPQVAADPSSLILRNLTRGARMGLPSGQAVARAMGVTPLGRPDLGISGPAPLWFYVLKEAETLAGGRHLGPVGGRIVAEVFLGLLAMDPSSYLRHEPTWRPTLRARTPGEFTMPDLIEMAGHGLDVTS